MVIPLLKEEVQLTKLLSFLALLILLTSVKKINLKMTLEHRSYKLIKSSKEN